MKSKNEITMFNYPTNTTYTTKKIIKYKKRLILVFAIDEKYLFLIFGGIGGISGINVFHLQFLVRLKWD